MSKPGFAALALAATAAVTSFSSPAQEYPVKPVRVIVPFPPGGGIDMFARVLSQKVSDAIGQQVIVDNRPGAQGNIGTAAGAKAPPDGYTLTIGYAGTMTINPHMYRDPGFHPMRDFTPVSLGSVQYEVLAVHPTVPAKNMQELAALARARPDKLTGGSSASTGQLVVELFKQVNNVKLLHVAYKGAQFVITDLIAGYVDLAVASNAAIAPFHRSGRLRALVVAGPERSPVMPDVPSAPEAGMPALQVINWYAVVAPANTPKEIVARLNREVVRALNSPDVRDRLANGGLAAKASTPEELGNTIKGDYERLGKALRDAGIKPTL